MARSIIALWVVAILAALLYLAGIPNNPPGFYIDESSISYNASLIARSGHDEHGASWPLYFRAFGDYKNPVYLYLLAGIFRLSGPSMLVARLLSEAAVVGAAITLGLLARRMTRSDAVALLTAILALLTPWLFETGRVVMEVALYPLAIALLLIALHRAAIKRKWSRFDILSIAAALALLTYTYSIGRLLGPLLALGLIFFITRERWVSVFKTWAAYAIALFPLIIFNDKQPGALAERFKIIGYFSPKISFGDTLGEFVRHYFGNLDLWRLLVSGDPNPDQVAHIFGAELFLAAGLIFAVAGMYLVLRLHRREAWWRFVSYGLLISIVPASLTNDYFHMLRLIAVPVFLLVFAIPALAWFIQTGRLRALFAILLLGTALQAAAFQWKFHRSARLPRRLHLFDAEYRQKIFNPAIKSAENPIYIADALAIPGYSQAFWYATLDGVDLARFKRLPAEEGPPLGALVISTEENCPHCDVIAETKPYTLYRANQPPTPRVPLPDEAFRVSISVIDSPAKVDAKKQATVRVRVKNISSVVWLARQRSGGKFQVSLGNHWLDPKGATVVSDDGRSALLADLQPGEQTELKLTINAPRQRGDYLVELDMLQEGVSWFELKGSQVARVPIRVE
jgi:4-amino-4-deoxy-L-arabinose transferase-like glycosyltransferase